MALADDLSSWDRVICAPTRFALMSVLSKVDSMGFAELRRVLRVSASVLSRQVTVLEDAGYVSVEKIVRGRRVLTEISATDDGTRAYRAQWALLKRLAHDEPTNQ